MADSKDDVKEPAHFTYIWTIENTCFPCYVESPVFTVKEMEMTKWQIWIFTELLDFVSIRIWREDDDGPDSIEIKFELSFLGIHGLPLIEKVDVEKFEKGDDFHFSKFADTKNIFCQRRIKFLPEDVLTVRCRMWRIGTGISQLDSCFARTVMRPQRRYFIWAIREFSTLQRNQVKKIHFNTTSTSHMTFNFFVTEQDGEEYINISTQNSDNEGYDWYNVIIDILDFEGKVVHSIREPVYSYRGYKEFNIYRKSKLLNDKDSLLPNDVLTLRCKVIRDQEAWNVIENYRYLNPMTSGGTETDAGEILCYEQDKPSNVSPSFKEAMKSLIEDGSLSDVSLQTNSKSFSAHKCILSARSPVFKAMFSGDMKEKTGKSVEIPDLDEATLRELLSYIYTDTVAELQWRGAADLYRAADKYELLDLKTRCSTFLKTNLSVSSVCTVLILADMHHDQELREVAQDFITRQEVEFFASDAWRSFKKGNPNLALEILERIVCTIKRHN
ncbi:unnamed protein product [Larinioides sclopetarius]|uniref:BTB domain-containing protein n=1 Tax=Larinioides sclopetarius TaxID=280406 RepID=A0AAV1ZUA8_9ARAC